MTEQEVGEIYLRLKDGEGFRSIELYVHPESTIRDIIRYACYYWRYSPEDAFLAIEGSDAVITSDLLIGWVLATKERNRDFVVKLKSRQSSEDW